MISNTLKGKKYAILVADGFEESEFLEPKKAILDHGGYVEVVSLHPGEVRSWKDGNWSSKYKVQKTVEEVKASDYDGLVLPGGVINPDKLRRSQQAVDFVAGFFQEGSQKPVAAICHAPWMLIEADVVRGRHLTSFFSLQTDLENAGAHWVDKEVVVDKGLVTSRSPRDLPVFNQKMIEEFREGQHTMPQSDYQAGYGY